MGTLYLVRHGQASFGAVLRGTLRRHQQSLEAIASTLPGLPAATEWPGLNEYDSAAVVATVHTGPLPAADSPEAYRRHFRLLREGLAQWMAGAAQPQGMPTWQGFVAGVGAALDHVRTQCEGDVLLVSSGGPIATAVAQVLGAPSAAVVELNLRIRNSALTEFAFTPKRHMLLSFNTLPHLDHPERSGWVTYT